MDVTFARFVSALRNADVRVSPAETLTAFDVVRRVGIADQALLKDSLALALAKSQDEKSRFDDTFERFFFQLAFQEPAKRTFLAKFDAKADREAALEALQGDISAQLVDAVAAVLNDDRTALAVRVQQVAESLNIHEISSLREKSVFARQIAEALAIPELEAYAASGAYAAGGGHGDGEISEDLRSLLRYLRHYFHEEIRAYVDAQYRLHADASGKRALLEAALKSNLNQLPKAYHDEVRRVVQKLADKLAKEHRRRARHTNRGVPRSQAHVAPQCRLRRFGVRPPVATAEARAGDGVRPLRRQQLGGPRSALSTLVPVRTHGRAAEHPGICVLEPAPAKSPTSCAPNRRRPRSKKRCSRGARAIPTMRVPSWTSANFAEWT